MQLRPYQVDLVDRLRDGYRSGVKRQLVVSPTGSGKTVFFSFVCHSAVQLGKRVCIVAHRKEILDQIIASLLTFGVRCNEPDCPVSVLSVQTAARRLDVMKAPDLLIIDESHHCTSSTYVKILAAWSTASVLGVTATPERLDGRGLGEFFPKMILGPTTRWLMDNGFLSKAVYYAPAHKLDLSAVRKIAGDYDKAQLAEIVDRPSITGDAVQTYLKHCRRLRAVVFCISIAHAEHTAAVFKSAGVPSESIDGKLSKDERDRRVNALRSGDILVLTSCELISEGFDLPSVAAAILLRPTASLAMYLQQVGRALRPKPDGGHATILDHVGNCLRHGLAEEEREWSLEGKTAKKRKEPEPKTCKKCYAIYQGRICPQCGEEPEGKPREIDQEGGELAKVDPSILAGKRTDARQKIREAKTLADFRSIAKDLGYKPGWAWHRWQDRIKRPLIDRPTQTAPAFPEAVATGDGTFSPFK